MNATFFLLNAFAQEDFMQKLQNAVKVLNVSARICPAVVVNGKSENPDAGAVIYVDGILPEIMRSVAVLKAQCGEQPVFVSAMREQLPPAFRFGRMGLCNLSGSKETVEKIKDETVQKLQKAAAGVYGRQGINLTFCVFEDDSDVRVWSLSAWFDNPNYHAWQLYSGKTAVEAGCPLIFKSTFVNVA